MTPKKRIVVAQKHRGACKRDKGGSRATANEILESRGGRGEALERNSE